MQGAWQLLFGAFALVLVIEGFLPFVSPAAWRAAFERASRLTDGQLRFIGLVSMLIGVLAWAVCLS